MRCAWLFAVIVLVPLGTSPAAAQVPEPLELSEDAKRYLRAVSGREISTDIGYFAPRRPAPELKLKDFEAPGSRAEQEEEDGDPYRLTSSLIFGVLLVLLVALILRFSAAPSISTKRQSEGRRAGLGSSGRHAADPQVVLSLEEIAALRDRREALILLGRAALDRAAGANGIRLGRGWTARDALRRIPQDWPNRGLLADLARAAEIAHFGGRPVSEQGFQTQLSAARPLFYGGHR